LLPKENEPAVSTWKKRNPQHKAFNCSFAWHYRKSGLYLAVYYLLGSITSGGKNSFFSSIEKIAVYFDADYETVRRIIKQLVIEGWLKRDPQDIRKLWWVDHTEWVKTHEGKCCTRAVLVWEAETDPFVGKIYAVLEGKVRLYENWVIAIRKCAPDDEILRNMRLAVDATKAKLKVNGKLTDSAAKDCFWKVHRHLRSVAKNREHYQKEAQANQRDGQI
jgi:hypothetical protein